MALRNDPAPLSAVVVTVIVLACTVGARHKQKPRVRTGISQGEIKYVFKGVLYFSEV
jgi:hypothetical protein